MKLVILRNECYARIVSRRRFRLRRNDRAMNELVEEKRRSTEEVKNARKNAWMDAKKHRTASCALLFMLPLN